MSLATWEKEFYPITASKCKKKDALDHSILKWTGLLPKNREKHGMTIKHKSVGLRRYNYITSEENGELVIRDVSCALCIIFDDCADCPLLECDFEYKDFLYHKRVRPMLNLLLKTKKELEK